MVSKNPTFRDFYSFLICVRLLILSFDLKYSTKFQKDGGIRSISKFTFSLT